MNRAGLIAALWALAAAFAAPDPSAAQNFEFHGPPAVGDPSTARAMRDLAVRLLPVYQDSDPDRYLANLAVLQLAAGDFSSAAESRKSLRERRRDVGPGQDIGRGAVLDIYARAKVIEAQKRIPFAEAASRAYGEVFSRLSDHDAFMLSHWLSASPAESREDFQRRLDEQRPKDSLDRHEAETLLSAFAYYESFRSLAPLVAALNAADDARRYVGLEAVEVKVPGLTALEVSVVRPKNAKAPLPALLELGLDHPTIAIKESAAHGYVGVWARILTRSGTAAFVPFQHDGRSAARVIDWIVHQRWSDGRVAMGGEGYSGFTAWAAAKRPPAALKAIAVSDPLCPGVDMPMSGGIFQNSAYRWSLLVTQPEEAAQEAAGDDSVSRALDEKWYRSGRRYRDLGLLFGRPNPIFIRWLNHPSYDRFWQSMVPFRKDFARIDFPVLTMTGYFASAEPAALYYFSEHRQNDPRADHTLLIGPYDDEAMQHGASGSVRGYDVDEAARVDLPELRYRWLDHALKGASAPALLADRVNFEVMGANEWRHVPSIDAMAGESLKFYLSAADASGTAAARRLTQRKKPGTATFDQTVSLTDRSDAGWLPAADLATRSLVTRNSLTFASRPLKKPTDFNGLLRGRLDFVVNKMDFDINIAAYELSADGSYLRLFNPAAELRLSYAAERGRRHLLKAGERQQVSFASERLTSRRLAAGSRLVIVLRVAKRPDREINYGTGGDVSEESIEDGRIPIKVRWYSDSYIEVPAASAP